MFRFVPTHCYINRNSDVKNRSTYFINENNFPMIMIKNIAIILEDEEVRILHI